MTATDGQRRTHGGATLSQEISSSFYLFITCTNLFFSFLFLLFYTNNHPQWPSMANDDNAQAYDDPQRCDTIILSFSFLITFFFFMMAIEVQYNDSQFSYF